MGFHSRWIMWMQGCLESATVSVLVNGSPTEEFKPSRGLRQGDPLAAFLFIMVAEGLVGLVRQAVKNKLLSGIIIGEKELALSILQFADDTLFLYEDSLTNVLSLKAILRGFELTSGLKINFHKSRLAGVNVPRSSIEHYTETLNCEQMSIPFTYLGIEVGGNPRKKKFWEPVLNKLKSRLSVWKGRFLSMAEHRSRYAKALLAFKGGLYGGGERRRYRSHGSVGRMYVNYERKEDRVSRISAGLILCSWLNGDGVISLMREGGGRNAWNLSMGQRVEELGVWEESGWRWKLKWRRGRFEWEIPMELELGMHISRANVSRDEKDAQIWRGDEVGCFSVSSAYECLTKYERGPQLDVFNFLWKIKAFPNVMITTWRVLLGRMPTRECLSRRGVLLNTTACALCQSEEESCHHLFIECKCACCFHLGRIEVHGQRLKGRLGSSAEVAMRAIARNYGYWSTKLVCDGYRD
ncbi:uncharacterized protein [Phaseolus vulgaris]|uniref:uncharacterized protein n=1 Tax=Phaseolus vulgaris TaxID=3885 RepID=UPI0035CA0392